MKRLAEILATMIVLSVPLSAQVVISGQVNYEGNSVPYAPIQVCAVTATGTPCVPVSTLYYDYDLSNPAPNPTIADQWGNYTYYAPTLASPSFYEVQVTPIERVVWSYVVNGGNNTVSEIISINGTTVTNPNINGTTPVAQAGYTIGKWLVSGSNVSVEIPSTITVNGQPCNLGGSCTISSGSTIDLQTNGTDNAVQSKLNLIQGTNTTITSDSAGGVTINSTGGTDADAVHYNPTTTSYQLVSSSITIADYPTNFAPAVTAGAWTADGTTVTVNTTAAHGYATGDYVLMDHLTTWFCSNCTDTNTGVFQITVTSPTQFTFPYTANTGSGSGGSVYNASLWGAYQTANMPFIKGHGAFTQKFSFLSNLDTNFSTLVNCSAGTPTYLILEVGQNDLFTNGDSVVTVKGHFEDVWAKAHAAGCVVVQGLILPTSYGGGDTDTFRGEVAQLNEWLALQSKGVTGYPVTTGAVYWDRWVEFGPDLYDANNYSSTSASGAHAFAAYINRAFSAQESDMTGHNPEWTAWTGGGFAYGFAGRSLSFLNSYYVDTFEINPNAAEYVLRARNSTWQSLTVDAGFFNPADGPSYSTAAGYAYDDTRSETIFGTNARLPVEIDNPNAAVTAFQRSMFNKTTFRWCPKDENNHLSGCTTGLSRYADGVLSVDGPNFNDGLGILRSSGSQLIGVATDPVSPVNGQSWYNSTSNLFKFYQNGTVEILGSGGGSSVIHATITVGTTSVPANSCLPTGTTYSTATMTGVTTSMTFSFTWSTDYSAVSGWTPSTPGLYFTSYPTANTLNYQVCNATSTAIVPGSSTTWNVSAQ